MRISYRLRVHPANQPLHLTGAARLVLRDTLAEARMIGVMGPPALLYRDGSALETGRRARYAPLDG
jgi:hypothetical protein